MILLFDKLHYERTSQIIIIIILKTMYTVHSTQSTVLITLGNTTNTL